MIERIDDRLWQWAKELSGSVLGYSMTPLARWVDNKGVFEGSNHGGSTLMISPGALETEKAVKKLPADMQRVVKVHYFNQNASAERLAKRAGCSKATYYRKLDAAHVLLSAELYGTDLPNVS